MPRLPTPAPGWVSARQRPVFLGTSRPNSHPCVAGTLFNTSAFAHNLVQGTFGNAGRNIIEGPGYKTWHMSLVKQFPIR
ncbi:MAG TPA: hypothetical protein VMQ17_27620 [Candidatus Sulfotelmatobacter sp.]|nr:hypothetical protein [Candidatus Sulfotelmatobacter sp.]